MKYQNGGAFRRALEDRLRAQSLKSSVALVRLRKMVAFDRFLARLLLAQPDTWVLKERSENERHQCPLFAV